MASFAVQRLLSLIRSHLFILFLFSYCRRWIKKILLQFLSECVLPMFSSKNFIISSLTFRSSIYFEFIFMYGVTECSISILLHVAVQFSQDHLLKRLYIVYSCLLCHRLIDHRCMGLFLGFLFCSINLYFCSNKGLISKTHMQLNIKKQTT